MDRSIFPVHRTEELVYSYKIDRQKYVYTVTAINNVGMITINENIICNLFL